MAGGKVTGARTRTDAPDADDPGLVVRTVGPVTFDWGTSSLQNGTQTTVTSAADVEVLAANAARKSAIVQNVGLVNARIGVAGVTATTGIQLIPGAMMLLEEPFVPTQEIHAISEGADTTIFAAEAV